MFSEPRRAKDSVELESAAKQRDLSFDLGITRHMCGLLIIIIDDNIIIIDDIIIIIINVIFTTTIIIAGTDRSVTRCNLASINASIGTLRL